MGDLLPPDPPFAGAQVLARFAVIVPPSDECARQIGILFDFAKRRADAFYWLDHRFRGRRIAAQGTQSRRSLTQLAKLLDKTL
jgi:hypothetical protein